MPTYAFSLKQEQETLYVKIAESYFSKMNEIYIDYFNFMKGILEKSKYNLMKEQITTMAEENNELITTNFKKNIFVKWSTSNNSLVYLIEQKSCGEMAIDRAKGMQNKINGYVSTFKLIEDFSYTETNEIDISIEEIDELIDITKKTIKNVQELNKKYFDKIKTQSEENLIFGTLKILVIESGNQINILFNNNKNSLEAFKDGVNQKLNEESARLQESLDEISKQASDDSNNTMTSILGDTSSSSGGSSSGGAGGTGGAGASDSTTDSNSSANNIVFTNEMKSALDEAGIDKEHLENIDENAEVEVMNEEELNDLIDWSNDFMGEFGTEEEQEQLLSEYKEANMAERISALSKLNVPNEPSIFTQNDENDEQSEVTNDTTELIEVTDDNTEQNEEDDDSQNSLHLPFTTPSKIDNFIELICDNSLDYYNAIDEILNKKAEAIDEDNKTELEKNQKIDNLVSKIFGLAIVGTTTWFTKLNPAVSIAATCASFGFKLLGVKSNSVNKLLVLANEINKIQNLNIVSKYMINFIICKDSEDSKINDNCKLDNYSKNLKEIYSNQSPFNEKKYLSNLLVIGALTEYYKTKENSKSIVEKHPDQKSNNILQKLSRIDASETNKAFQFNLIYSTIFKLNNDDAKKSKEITYKFIELSNKQKSFEELNRNSTQFFNIFNEVIKDESPNALLPNNALVDYVNNIYKNKELKAYFVEMPMFSYNTAKNSENVLSTNINRNNKSKNNSRTNTIIPNEIIDHAMKSKIAITDADYYFDKIKEFYPKTITIYSSMLARKKEVVNNKLIKMNEAGIKTGRKIGKWLNDKTEYAEVVKEGASEISEVLDITISDETQNNIDIVKGLSDVVEAARKLKKTNSYNKNLALVNEMKKFLKDFKSKYSSAFKSHNVNSIAGVQIFQMIETYHAKMMNTHVENTIYNQIFDYSLKLKVLDESQTRFIAINLTAISQTLIYLSLDEQNKVEQNKDEQNVDEQNVDEQNKYDDFTIFMTVFKKVYEREYGKDDSLLDKYKEYLNIFVNYTQRFGYEVDLSSNYSEVEKEILGKLKI